MSADAFTILHDKLVAAGRTDLAYAAERIWDWVKTHPDAQYVEASDVVDETRPVDPVAVARALALMSEAGLLVMKYAVAPRSTHTRLEELFPSRKEIPEELYDWKLGRFDRDDAEIYPVFVRAAGC